MGSAAKKVGDFFINPVYSVFKEGKRQVKKLTPDIPKPPAPPKLQDSMSPTDVVTGKPNRRTRPPSTLLTGSGGVEEKLGTKTLLGG